MTFNLPERLASWSNKTLAASNPAAPAPTTTMVFIGTSFSFFKFMPLQPVPLVSSSFSLLREQRLFATENKSSSNIKGNDRTSVCGCAQLASGALGSWNRVDFGTDQPGQIL